MSSLRQAESTMAHMPRGLQELETLDHIFVKQRIENFELMYHRKTNNEYTILNNQGEAVLFAVEVTEFLQTHVHGVDRPFTIMVLDLDRNEVIRLGREFSCNMCSCFPGCGQTMVVYSPPSNLVGTVEQIPACFSTTYNIKNESGTIEFLVQSDSFSNTDYKISAIDDKTEIGKISKLWAGFTQKWFTDADNFGISFPVDLEVHTKAVMIGTCILINFMYFETTEQPQRRRLRRRRY